MFSNFGYGRRPTTITTYKRKRIDPLPATLSDDDSDLDEPILSGATNTRSSPGIKLGNNKSSYDGSSTTTNIQHPISNFLDKQLEINTRDISGALEEESRQQQQQQQQEVEPTQASQSQQQITVHSSLQTTVPVVQSSSVAGYQGQPASSFSIPTVENSSSTLDMAPLNLFETSQHVQQQYQMFETSFQAPSQPLPPILDTPFDWMSLGSAFGQGVSLLPPAHDPLMLLQPQVQQQEGFAPAHGNELAASSSTPRPTDCDNSLILIQPPPVHSVANTDTLGNIAVDNNNHTEKAKNVVSDVYVRPETIITSTATTTSSLSPMQSSSSSSSFDIFEIPEIPTPSISHRSVEKQSSKYNDDTSFDIFDFPLENTIPKITKKYQSPIKRSSTITTATATTAEPAETKAAKKDAKQAQFDIFDFPEEDDTNIVELKMISTQSPSFSSLAPSSSSSLPLTNNNEQDKRPLKRDVSQGNIGSSTVAKEPSQLKQQQRRKSMPLKKSKSDTLSSSGRRVRFAPEILVSTFYRTSLDRSQPFSAPTFSEEIVKETEECSFSIPTTPQSLPHQQQLPIKRKRNLVSRLRGATGAVSIQTSDCPSLRKYNFDEDEDEDDVGEEENVTETSKITDEDDQDYRQRMQRELVAMMENEFGQEEEQEEEKQRQENIAFSRPQYQPKNAMNVRVTYKSSKKHHHLQQNGEGQQGQDREMIELDNLLDKLRAGSTDL